MKEQIIINLECNEIQSTYDTWTCQNETVFSNDSLICHQYWTPHAGDHLAVPVHTRIHKFVIFAYSVLTHDNHRI